MSNDESTINLTDISPGDQLTVELENGERFEKGLVSGTDISIAQDRHEITYVSLTFEGGFWEQVRDRVDSEVLEMRQDSDYGGSPLEQPRLIGTIWEEDNESEQKTQYEELGKIAKVIRHE